MVAEGEVEPDGDEPQEMSSSGAPPIAGGSAPVEPPPVKAPPQQPTAPPGEVPDLPIGMQPFPPPPDSGVSILREPGFMFMQNSQIVGDLDGDGFDDFVVFSMAVPDGIRFLTPPESAAYLFYGRRELRETIEATSADAVLRGVGFAVPLANQRSGGASGDLSGDGFADLVIGGVDVAYFIFGSEERLRGEQDIADATVSWTFPATPMPSLGRSVRVASAGDVQGDGLSDFTLTVTTDELVTQFEGGVSTAPVDSTILVAGRSGDWPAGTHQAAAVAGGGGHRRRGGGLPTGCRESTRVDVQSGLVRGVLLGAVGCPSPPAAPPESDGDGPAPARADGAAPHAERALAWVPGAGE